MSARSSPLWSQPTLEVLGALGVKGIKCSGALAERPLESMLPAPGVWSEAESSLRRVHHMTPKKEQLGSLLGDKQALHQHPFTGLKASLFLVASRSFTSFCLSVIRILIFYFFFTSLLIFKKSSGR